MSPEAWKALVTFISGGTVVGLLVAFFRFVGSGRKQDAAMVDRLTARVIDLERAERECNRKVTELSVELAGLKATVIRMDAASATAVIVADDQGIIQEWNHGATTLFGYSIEEMTSPHKPVHVSIIVPPRFRGPHDTSFAKAVAEHRGPDAAAAARIRESYALTKDGDEIPVTITLYGWELAGKRLFSAEIKRR